MKERCQQSAGGLGGGEKEGRTNRCGLCRSTRVTDSKTDVRLVLFLNPVTLINSLPGLCVADAVLPLRVLLTYLFYRRAIVKEQWPWTGLGPRESLVRSPSFIRPSLSVVHGHIARTFATTRVTYVSLDTRWTALIQVRAVPDNAARDIRLESRRTCSLCCEKCGELHYRRHPPSPCRCPVAMLLRLSLYATCSRIARLLNAGSREPRRSNDNFKFHVAPLFSTAI